MFLMRSVWKSECFVVNERSSLYSGLILKESICLTRLHKRPVEVLRRRSGAFSSSIHTALRIASSASDRETYCLRSSAERD
jgi:hypothetical protein